MLNPILIKIGPSASPCNLTGRWRKLHKKELHSLYSSQNITVRVIIQEEWEFFTEIVSLRFPSVVLYTYKTLTLREEQRLRVFENRELRRIFDLRWKMDKTT
jgi:hypothetical protein